MCGGRHNQKESIIFLVVCKFSRLYLNFKFVLFEATSLSEFWQSLKFPHEKSIRIVESLLKKIVLHLRPLKVPRKSRC